MNAREEASKSFQKLHAKAFGYDYKNIGCESASRFVNLIIEAVKEDIKEEYRIKIIDAQTSREPELIQGYTAEQWQEIIDGGYLCEFVIGKNAGESVLDSLEIINDGHFKRTNGGEFMTCRPAQIKGVMRPIWVGPIDKKSRFHFFHKIRSFIFNPDLTVGMARSEGAISYIEL